MKITQLINSILDTDVLYPLLVCAALITLILSVAVPVIYDRHLISVEELAAIERTPVEKVALTAIYAKCIASSSHPLEKRYCDETVKAAITQSQAHPEPPKKTAVPEVHDYCLPAWYDDGECEDFCVNFDPDCVSQEKK